MTAEPPTNAPPDATRRAPSIVLVATGDGKGKTTAAMGTVLRALERGWEVCVVQFVKSGKWNSGEAALLTKLGAEWHTMGDGFSWEVTTSSARPKLRAPPGRWPKRRSARDGTNWSSWTK